eukprot:716709-Lingulodinium_polyedra.AAC.1
MPKTQSSNRALVASSKASKSWQTHVTQSSKSVIDQMLVENPTFYADVEKFVLSKKRWQEDAANPSDEVGRFCRGRTINMKLPPTFICDFFAQYTPDVSKEMYLQIQKKAKDFVGRFQEFGMGMDGSSEISDTMDRRTHVWEVLAEDRVQFFGNRYEKVGSEVLLVMTDLENKRLALHPEWPFDKFGIYTLLVGESKPEIDDGKTETVVGIYHISGFEAWPSVLDSFINT